MKTTDVIRLDDEKADVWEQFVESHPNATPYHKQAWGRAVEDAYGFKCHYFAAFQFNCITGILPIVQMKTLSQKTILCALPYCDTGGALATNEESKKALINAAFNFASQLNITTIELRNISEREVSIDTAPENKKVRMLLDLPDNSEMLLKSFKSKLRSQIRKAEKNGLTSQTLKYPIDSQNVEMFYEVIAKNMKLLGSPVHSLEWYQAILSNYKDNAFISLVTFEDQTVGAALTLLSADKAVIPWASTVVEYNRLAPNMLLYWTVLESSIQRDAHSFDFGRSTVGEGTYNFKKQWGCQPQLLDWQHYFNGKIQKEVNANKGKTRELVESIWKKLPLKMTKQFGPVVRKHISL